MTGAEHTRTEIEQQPALWRQVADQAAEQAADDTAFLAPLLAETDLRIVLTGAGTSAFAGELLAPLLRRRLGRRVEAVSTTDIVSAPRDQFADAVPTLLVSFARSGDSPESVAATELAEQLLVHCQHLVVTCNPDGELARRHRDRADSRVLLMPAGSNDRGFAMTSSFTCMVLAVWLRLGGQDPASVPALSEAADRVISERRPDAAELAERLAAPGGRIVYLGSGALFGLAQESALKILELTAGQVVAVADTALGFRHGPKSIVNERTTAVVYLSSDPYTRQYDTDIAAELRRHQIADRVITIGLTGSAAPGSTGESTGESTEDWTLPWSPGAVEPGAGSPDDAGFALLAVLCAQLIGLECALAVGTTPDNPFPSGSVNRVVQGVVIHPLPASTPAAPPEPVEGRRSASHRAVL